MSIRLAHQTLLAIAFFGLACCLPAKEQSRSDLFQGVMEHSDDEMSRYRYLLTTLPQLSREDKAVALQFLAATENELGLYSEAVRDFPLRSQPVQRVDVPRASDWEAVDAVDAIVKLAGERRIVMVNEAHHDAHTRILTLALLPKLRAAGFNYFAAEALDGQDTDLSSRGFPVARSGSEYLHEPIYGDILREAIRLGFKIVPYETVGHAGQQREDGQAKNLYERVFAKDPEARLFVHAGYAHIDKARGRLGPVTPMAERLQQLTGIPPLSIDQTDIREDEPVSELDAATRAESEYITSNSLLSARATTRQLLGTPSQKTYQHPNLDIYEQILSHFHLDKPFVLRNRSSGAIWSARPKAYDVSVILPIGNNRMSSYAQGPVNLRLGDRRFAIMPPASAGERPKWLTLDGTRKPVPVSTQPCRSSIPCLVEAHYADEPDNAIAADRYVFVQDRQQNVLYLRPGRFRIRYVDADGHMLGELQTEVSD
jgi:hypothetical protein